MIRVLMVDDNLADVELCLQELKRAQFAISVDLVRTPADFTDRLGTESYDVVLSDVMVHGWTGLQALALLQEHEQEIPFILVTKSLETEIVDEFMRKGASDCVDKARLGRLPLAVAITVINALVTRDGDHRISVLSVDGSKVTDTKRVMTGGFRP